MTKADVFVQILSEVSGKPKELVGDLLTAFRKTFPGQDRFDDELPDAEASQLLAGLRKEKEGIRAWLNSGFYEVLLRTSPPQGRA